MHPLRSLGVASTLALALLGCGGDGVSSSGGPDGPTTTPRTFAACDPSSDFQNARMLPGLDDAMTGRTYLSNYYIEASLTDAETDVYFAACAADQRPACDLYHAALDQDGRVIFATYVDSGARSPRHPSISPDGTRLVWTEEVGRSTRIFSASSDTETFGPNFFTDRHEILQLEEGSSVRYVDPYIARNNRIYVARGPSSGVSTVYSTPISASEDPVMLDPKLTGNAPVIDGADRVFLARYDTNTGLRKILTSERTAGKGFSEPTDRYVKALNEPGTSNYPTWISKDGCRLYFTRGTQESVSTYRIWIAERKPRR